MKQQNERSTPLQRLLREREEQWRRRLEEVKRWAEWLAKALRGQGIIVERILLFGSVARGDFTVDSDVDLIIVSGDWRRLTVTERLGLLYRLWDKPVDATFLAVTPGELYRLLETSIVVRDARRYWVQVYP